MDASKATEKKPGLFSSFFKKAEQSNLVLKLAPNYWLLSEISKDKKGAPFVRNLIQFPLPRQVDPNRPNLDLEILQDTLVKLVDENELDGRDVTILLPSSFSATRTYNVPFDVEKKADLKEFLISSQEKEFWQEFDSEVQECKLPIFDTQYLAPGEEEGTSHIFVSWASQEILNKYIDLALSARLQPVALIPELQAVLNLLIPQLDRLEREGFFGILHLARGRSKLLAVSPERIASAQVNISDLDEELLDEIESVDDISGDFWAEVGARIGSSLKQAVMYLREQEGVPPLRNIYVISEANQIENMLSLVKTNFNLGTLKGWQPLNQLAKNSIAIAPALGAISNQTVWASLVGGGLQGLMQRRLNVGISDQPRFQLNLHPQRDRLFANRQYRRVSKKANWTTFAFLSIFACWLVLGFVPQYFRMEREISRSQLALQSVNQKKGELQNLVSSSQSNQTQLDSLVKADKPNAKTRLVMTLPSLLPNGVELSDMQFDESSISIKGFSTKGSGAQGLLSNINDAQLIRAPLLKILSRADGRINFSIDGSPGMVN